MNRTEEQIIHDLADEILMLLLKDQKTFNPDKMKLAAEYMARAVQDLINQGNMERETLLKGTRAKLKIAGNCLYEGLETKTGK